jgi:hypothetical protein
LSFVAERLRLSKGEAEHRRCRREHEQPNAALVDVQCARQPGVPGPSPPDGSESERTADHSMPARIVRQESGHLRDREHEHEVEEEFERRDRVLAAADAFRRRRCFGHRQDPVSRGQAPPLSHR